MELPAIVTLLAVLEYMIFSLQVGFGRVKHDIQPPPPRAIRSGIASTGSR